MEGFYALLGVHFTNIGTLEGCPDEEAALQFVREATDNAIRHGNATEITITAKKLDEAFLLEVANNGSVPADLVFHNGLSSLKATLEEEGGELTLVTTPSFAIAARFPYSH